MNKSSKLSEGHITSIMFIKMQYKSVNNVMKSWAEILYNITQQMKFSIKDFFSKFDQILRKLWVWSHLLKKSLMENFIFSVV